MATGYIKKTDVQKRFIGIYVKQADVQVRIVRAYQKIAGVQTLIYQAGFDLVISANTTTFDIHAALLSAGWNGTDPIGWTLTINSGIFVRATTTSNYAIDTGAPLPSGSGPFLITNLGKAQGKGGAAGNGGVGVTLPTVGLTGGAAIRAQYPISIANGSGFILGGGGGGPGGKGDRIVIVGKGGSTTDYGGGGGGGGAGNGALGLGGVGSVSGANGTAGTNTLTTGANGNGGAHATGGGNTSADGGNGGDWGAAGSNTTVSGGAAGKAIESGGNTITWISGNDGTHVKGAVS